MRELADEDDQRAYRYAVALAGNPQDGFDLLHSVLSHLFGARWPELLRLPPRFQALCDACRRGAPPPIFSKAARGNEFVKA